MIKIAEQYVKKMKNSPRYRWYKPVLALILAIPVLLILVTILEVIKIVIQFMQTGDMNFSQYQGAVNAVTTNYLSMDSADALGMFILAMNIFILVPSLAFGLKLTHLGEKHGLLSVENKFRWKRFFTYLPGAIGVMALNVILILVHARIVGKEIGQARLALLPILVILCTIPLQAFAEEYLFRGFFLQAFGSWVPGAILPILLQALVFTAGHRYNLLGNGAILVSGILWGYLATVTGGLEAGTAAHVTNNVCALILAAIFPGLQTQKNLGVLDVVEDLTVTVIMFAVIFLISKKHKWLISDISEESESNL